MVKPFGYWGLALGTSIAAIFNAVFLLRAIAKILASHGGEMQVQAILRGLVQYGAMALGLGGVCFLTYSSLVQWIPGGAFYLRAFRVCFLIAEGLAWALICSKVFHLEELQEAVDLFTKKIKKKLSRNGT